MTILNDPNGIPVTFRITLGNKYYSFSVIISLLFQRLVLEGSLKTDRLNLPLLLLTVEKLPIILQIFLLFLEAPLHLHIFSLQFMGLYHTPGRSLHSHLLVLVMLQFLEDHEYRVGQVLRHLHYLKIPY